MKYKKSFTAKEWNQFKKIESGSVVGNDMKFFNFFTQRFEAYDYVTRQEMLLRRYKITLTNYRERKYVKTRYPNDRVRMIKVGEMCPTPLKEQLELGLKNLPSKMTSENLNKGFKKIDRFFLEFDKAMNSFSKGLEGNRKRDPNFWHSNKDKTIDVWQTSTKKESKTKLSQSSRKSTLSSKKKIKLSKSKKELSF